MILWRPGRDGIMKLKEMILWSDYGLLLYIFLGIAGIAIFNYLLVAGSAVINILNIASVKIDPSYQGIIYGASMGIPLLMAAVSAIPKRRYGASILKYFAFILNFSTFILYLTIPLAGLSLISYVGGEFRLAPINRLFISLADIIVSAVMLMIISRIQSSIPWIIVRIGFKEGSNIVGALRALPKDNVIKLPEGRSLLITMYSYPERLKEVSVGVEPRSDWRVSKTESEDKVSFDLTPISDTNSELSIVVSGEVVKTFKIAARALIRFATLVVELVRGGKVVKIIEIEHPVGTPLVSTLKRITKLIPDIGDLSKYHAFLEAGGNFRKIDLNYSGFEPRRKYHILLQPAGATPVTKPVQLTREWRAKPIKLTREWTAKPVEVTKGWAAKEVVPEEAVNASGGAQEAGVLTEEKRSDVEVVERLKLILEQIRSLGDDLW